MHRTKLEVCHRNPLCPCCASRQAVIMWPVGVICIFFMSVKEGCTLPSSSVPQWQSVDGDIFPNPKLHPRECNRPKASFICDPDKVLRNNEVEKLDFFAHDLHQSTTCLCVDCPPKNKGVSIGIFIKYNFTTERSNITAPAVDMIAKKLKQQWKLGSCDDDIVIVLLAQEKKSQFEMGRAVERVIPRKVAEKIFNDCIIHFENNNFLQGLESMINSFQDVLLRLQRQRIKSPTTKKTAIIIGSVLGIGVLLILIIVAVIIRCKQIKKTRLTDTGHLQADSFSELEKQPTENKHEYSPCDSEEKTVSYESSSSDEGSDSDDSNEEVTYNCSELSKPRFDSTKRHLSDVLEEIEEEDEAMAIQLALLQFNNDKNRSNEVTEL